jgi:hypothetical protein
MFSLGNRFTLFINDMGFSLNLVAARAILLMQDRFCTQQAAPFFWYSISMPATI